MGERPRPFQADHPRADSAKRKRNSVQALAGVAAPLTVRVALVTCNPAAGAVPRFLIVTVSRYTPAVTASDEVASKIRHGRPVNLPELSRAREVKVFHGQRDLIAISTRVAGTLFHPRIVLV